MGTICSEGLYHACNAGFTFLLFAAIMMVSLKHVLSCESRSYFLRSLR